MTPPHYRDPAAQGGTPLGAVLARLRHERGLTGQELGSAAGMSQAKISKIENGSAAPKPRDVLQIARALDAPAEVIRQLVDRAESEQDQFGSWRLVGPTPLRPQEDVAALEAKADEIRMFLAAVAP